MPLDRRLECTAIELAFAWHVEHKRGRDEDEYSLARGVVWATDATRVMTTRADGSDELGCIGRRGNVRPERSVVNAEPSLFFAFRLPILARFSFNAIAPSWTHKSGIHTHDASWLSWEETTRLLRLCCERHCRSWITRGYSIIHSDFLSIRTLALHLTTTFATSTCTEKDTHHAPLYVRHAFVPHLQPGFILTRAFDTSACIEKDTTCATPGIPRILNLLRSSKVLLRTGSSPSNSRILQQDTLQLHARSSSTLVFENS
ncbi:hypothetical protein BDN70DRAFT_901231 [Pholiota conissans]|uniref:Uncharacterized protein n=1 Tax=Pholiota conissans TaxID=109636 RepID=A0A9P5YQ14_9AGAR|nr:hypothetical protein BDN70DRAFT_901231 [Pholiota conissans]